MFENVLNVLNEIKTKAVKISQTTKGECIHQTERNKIGAELREALFADLSELFPVSESAEDIVAYFTKDGVILEVPNGSVKDNISNVNGSGAISLEIGFTVKGLEYNAQDESDAYKVDLAEKEAKAKAEAEKKAKNIAKDKAKREAKK
jgi:hypothetical protein